MAATRMAAAVTRASWTHSFARRSAQAGPSTGAAVGPSRARVGTASDSRALHTTQARLGPWDDVSSPPKGAKMNRYLVVAEDYANAGALARRLEVRDTHLTEAKAGVEAGRIELGGGLLSRDFKDIPADSSAVYSLAGSVFVVQGESIEDVQRRVESDQYNQAGVWDPSKIKIMPFLPAFLNAPKIEATPQEQHDAVQRRVPRHASRTRPGNVRRTEVYVEDPRASGKAINSADRKTVDSSLKALRRRFSGVPNTSHKIASDTSLETLRHNSTPPVYEHDMANVEAAGRPLSK